MTEPFTGQIDHPSAWRGCDFASVDDFSIDLDERHRNAFRNVVDRARTAGVGLQELTVAQAAMPEIAADLQAVRREITDGRGLVLLRGFPVEKMSDEELGIVFWAMGTHFGHAVSQSSIGDRLGYVTDVSKPGEIVRGYRSAEELNLHTDSDDIVGLLCIRQAMEGGETRLTSSVAVHNEIAARRPDLLKPLYEGFPYHRFGEQPPGEDDVTPYNVPVFCYVDGKLSACYIREFLHEAAWELGRRFTFRQEQALDLFEEIADREKMVLRFRMQPGEALFFNNYTVLHSRTRFKDWPETERKRLLLRLWLQADPPRPIDPNLRRYYGNDGVYAVEEGENEPRPSGSGQVE